MEQKLHDTLRIKIHSELPMVLYQKIVVIGIENLIDKKKMINAEHTAEHMFSVLRFIIGCSCS